LSVSLECSGLAPLCYRAERATLYLGEALHKKTHGASVARIISRAKAQRRKEDLRKRGSALRLCAFA